MRLFKTILILLFIFALTNICYAQKNRVAFADTKSFYVSENGISRLVDALKSANPDFHTLRAEEKDKEFNRITGKCSEAKKESSKAETNTLDAKEEAVCSTVKDIAESLEEFKRKHELVFLVDSSDCDRALDLCYDAIDITKQFVVEYNGAK